MWFGRTLAAAIHPPWRDNYIDYTRLKKLLREDEASPQREWTEQDEEDFVQELINVQLDKVHQFHVDTYKSLRDRTSECEAKLEPIAAAWDGHDAQPDQRSAVEDVMKELDSISKDIERLRKFSRINFTGFLKAAKKHDRKRGLRYRVQPILQVRLSQVPFHSAIGNVHFCTSSLAIRSSRSDRVCGSLSASGGLHSSQILGACRQPIGSQDLHSASLASPHL